MTDTPFAPPLSAPVLPEERYFVAKAIERDRAEQRIHEAICEGAFRPPDATRAARIDDLHALYVPFWRMDLQRTDESLSLTPVQVGKIGIPIPRTRTTDARATWMVCARTSFPYVMKHPSTLLPGDAKPLVVGLEALAHGDPDASGSWEVLDADVPQSQARHVGGASLARYGGGWVRHDIATNTELTVHAVHFVRYPVWFARYRYDGVATPAEGTFHVAVSAVDGQCLAARHPSKLRAGAAKVKGFFSSIGDHLSGEPDAGADVKSSDLAERFKAHLKKERGK
jgi:hypothetical protein